MRTTLLIASVLVLSAAAAESAPAPLRRSAPCEVVFDARTRGRAETAAAFLRSDHFLDELLQSAVVETHLAHLASPEERREWLRVRVSVRCDGQKVHVRFDGPLSILAVVANELTRHRPEAPAMRDEWARRAALLLRLRGRGCCAVNIDDDYYESLRRREWYDLLCDPPTVHRPPRRVAV